MAKLLVYEDNTAYWDELLACLSQRHAVVFVSTTEEAIEKLEERQFDMVVVAVHEADQTVFGLLQQVRSTLNSSNIPFVCLRGPHAPTGARVMDEAFRMASMMLGARGYVAANDYSSVLPGLEQYLSSGT